jgi:hypothetical protein
MRTKTGIPFYLFGVVILILVTACEDKPDFIGSDLLPSGDNFIVLFDSAEVIYGYTKPGDSLVAGFKETFLLGNVTDPVFGHSKAEIITTVSASVNSRGFGTNAQEDSVLILLALGERVGEGTQPVELTVYEYTEYIRTDSAYFTNMDITGQYREDPLGSTMISGGDSIVRIRVTDREFIDKFLTAPDSVMQTSAYIQELMNGLYFTTSDPADEGNIIKIDFDDARNYLYFYFRNDTSNNQNQYLSFVSQLNRRINLFNHDPSGYLLENYLTNGSENDSLLFIQSMAGVSSVIRFPALNKWVDSMPIAINEAKLILPLADSSSQLSQDKRYFPEQVNLYTVKNDGLYSLVYDQAVNEDTYGGEYDSDTRSYSFTIKVQMQSILSDTSLNLDMVLLPHNTASNLSRAILYGWNTDPQKRIRLEITYTKL